VRLFHRDIQACKILHGSVSSSNDGANPIGLRGRATDHYPMLKKSLPPEFRTPLRNDESIGTVALNQ
jgi:hypothetical protein